MRGSPTQHDIVAPATLAEALTFLPEHRPFAGGTDLMVAFERGLLPYSKMVSIWQLPELRGITIEGAHVVIGALTTYTDLIESKPVNEHLPALAAAARDTAAVAIRNRGTVGGNIANASPAADLPPPLLVYDAEIELTSSRGARWVPYDGFHTAYKATVMAADELITRVRMPIWKNARWAYRKVGTRKAQAISKVCMAATVRDSGEVRLAFGSVAPTVVRAKGVERRAEQMLKGGPRDIEAIAESVLTDAKPIDDIRSTADYRARVTVNLVRDWLHDL
jgi:CO/xanthine dehydrogenase FAD-binding subunit